MPSLSTGLRAVCHFHVLGYRCLSLVRWLLQIEDPSISGLIIACIPNHLLLATRKHFIVL